MTGMGRADFKPTPYDFAGEKEGGWDGGVGVVGSEGIAAAHVLDECRALTGVCLLLRLYWLGSLTHSGG